MDQKLSTAIVQVVTRFKHFDASVPITTNPPRKTNFRFMNKAKDWKLEVTITPDEDGDCLGSYAHDKDRIVLYTPDEFVFFHELAHAAWHRIKGEKKDRQWEQEITAELTALILALLVGYKIEDLWDEGYRYIRRYAGKGQLSPYWGCIRVLSDVENCLELILEKDSIQNERR